MQAPTLVRAIVYHFIHPNLVMEVLGRRGWSWHCRAR